MGTTVEHAPALHPAVHDETWIDLRKPDEAKLREVEAMTGLSLPRLEDLQEIESSSRLYVEGDALFMSFPVLTPYRHGEPTRSVPVGLVLQPNRLVTLHYADAPIFDQAIERARVIAQPTNTDDIFVTVLEEVVERVADVLERANEEMDRISQQIFRETPEQGGVTAEMRRTLRGIGRIGELVTKLRETMLGISRMLPFLATHAGWMPDKLKPRLETVRLDVRSLLDHDTHLSQRVQFLQEATLGFINIEQSNIIKIMTVVSVVAMPPTLIASIYGMNFEHMPELKWVWGYPLSLAMIVFSAVLPLLWFRSRRWL
jgi:magnesium transporter